MKSNQHFPIFLLLLFFLLPLAGKSQQAGPDIAISLSADNLSPIIYSKVTFRLQLNNTGDLPMTEIEIDFPVPSGLAFVSQTVGTGSYYNWVGKWDIGTLAVGETATLDLTLFTLSQYAISVYAEVAAHNEVDVDSSPGNGTPPTPNEDDEIAVSLNGSPTPCSFADFGLIISDCFDNSTADPADDYFTFSLNPSGSNLSGVYDVFGTSTNGPNFSANDIFYGQAYNSFNQLIRSGDIEVEIVDGSGVCQETFTVPAPSSCSSSLAPDLTISFLNSDPFTTFTTYTNTAFNFELLSENIGTGTSISFHVGTYLSEDNILSSDDQQLSSFTYAPLAGGQSEILTPAIYFGSTQAPGTYYLIIKTDDLENHDETDETNNITRRRIQIWSDVSLECESFYNSVDNIFCTAETGSALFETKAEVFGNAYKTIIDANGTSVPPSMGITVNQEGINVVDEKIEKRNQDGSLIYSLDIPTAITDDYWVRDADERLDGSGYVLSLFGAGSTSYCAFTDLNLNIINLRQLPQYIALPIIATEDGGALIGTSNAFPTFPQGTPNSSIIYEISPNNEVVNSFSVSTYLIGAKRLPCGSSRVEFEGQRVSGSGGSASNLVSFFELEKNSNDAYRLISDRVNGSLTSSPVIRYIDKRSWYLDSGTTYKFDRFFSPAVPNFNIPEQRSLNLQKYGPNNNLISTKDLDEAIFAFTGYFTLFELNNGTVFFLGKKYDRLWRYQLDCNANPPPLSCDNNLLSNPGYEATGGSYSRWFSLGGTSITNDANSGNYALLLSGSAPSGIVQNWPATEGESYTLSAQVKRTSAAGQGTGNYISLKFLSANWIPLETLVDIVPASANFQEYGRTYTAPAGTAYVEAKAFKDNGDFEMTIDDWCLVKDSSVDPCSADVEAPVFSNCPNDITVYTSDTSSTVDWTIPTATDNCGVSSIVVPPYAPGDDFPLGTYQLAYSASDQAFNSTSCTFSVTVIQQNNNSVDLSLTIDSDINSFSAWQAFTMTLILNNSGGQAATNVLVNFPEPAGVVFQGGNEYSASQGNYNPLAPQQWNVGNLEAGGTASITFNLFTIQDNDPIIGYGEVWSLDQDDSDSSPRNGICCVANEDDEAVLLIAPFNNDPNNREVADKGAFLALQSMYPNPAVNWMQVVVTSPEAQHSRIETYDLKGSLLQQQQLELNQGLNNIRLDISDLPTGMYLGILVDGKERKNRLKFVKIVE